MDTSSDALLILNKDGNIWACNRNVTELGYGIEDLVGKPFEVLIPEADRQQVLTAMADAFKTTNKAYFNLPIIPKGGTLKVYPVQWREFFDEATDSPRGAIVSIRTGSKGGEVLGRIASILRREETESLFNFIADDLHESLGVDSMTIVIFNSRLKQFSLLFMRTEGKEVQRMGLILPMGFSHLDSYVDRYVHNQPDPEEGEGNGPEGTEADIDDAPTVPSDQGQIIIRGPSDMVSTNPFDQITMEDGVVRDFTLPLLASGELEGAVVLGFYNEVLLTPEQIEYIRHASSVLSYTVMTGEGLVNQRLREDALLLGLPALSTDDEGRIIWANRYLGDLIGFEPVDIDGRLVADICSEGFKSFKDPPSGFSPFHCSLKKGDGTGVPVISIPFITKGEPTVFFVFGETELDSGRLLDFTAAFENTGDATILLDSDRAIRKFSTTGSKMLDYEQVELVGKSLSRILPGDHGVEKLSQMFQETDRSGRWRGELSLSNRNGDPVPTVFTMNRVASDAFSGYLVTVVDTTNLLELQKRLRDYGEKLEEEIDDKSSVLEESERTIEELESKVRDLEQKVEAEHDRSRKMESSNSLLFDLEKVPGTKEACDTILDWSKENFGDIRTLLLLVDEDTGDLRVRGTNKVGSGVLDIDSTYRAGDLPLKEVVQDLHPHVYEVKDFKVLGPLAGKDDLVQVIPLSSGEELAGIIMLMIDKKQLKLLDEEIMEALSRKTGHILNLQMKLEREHMKGAYHATAKEVERAILSNLEPAMVIDLLLKKVGSTMGADASMLTMTGSEEGVLVVMGTDPKDSGMEVGKVIDYSVLQITEFVNARDPLVKSLVDEEALDPVEKRFKENGMVSYISIPLLIGDELKGILALGSKKAGVFEGAVGPMSQEIAEAAALALNNSDVYSKMKEAEERYEVLVEKAVDGIFMVQSGRVRFANQGLADLLGRERSSMVGTSFAEIVVDGSREAVDKAIEARLRTIGSAERSQIGVLTGKGAEREAEVSMVSVVLDGTPSILGVMRDVTELNQAQREISHLKEYNEQILGATPLGILRFDNGGEIEFINPVMLGILGKGVKPKDGGFGKAADLPPLKVSGLDANLEALAAGKPFMDKVVPIDSKPDTRTVRVSGVPLMSKDETVEGGLLFMEDVSERETAAAEIRYLNELNQLVNSTIPSAIVVVDSELNVVYMNDNFARMANQKDASVLMGRAVMELVPPMVDRQADVVRNMKKAFKEDGPVEVADLTMKGSDGKDRHFHMDYIPLGPAGDRKVLLSIDEVTTLAETKRALALSEKQYRELFERADSPFITLDMDGKVMNMNLSAASSTGRKAEELAGTEFSSLLEADSRKGFEEGFDRARKGKEAEQEVSVPDPEGGRTVLSLTERPLIKEGEIVGVLVTGRDITEVCDLRQELASAPGLDDIDTSSLRDEMRAELQGEVRDQVRTEVRSELRNEVREEVRGEVKGEVTDEVRNELADDFERKLMEMKERLEQERPVPEAPAASVADIVASLPGLMVAVDADGCIVGASDAFGKRFRITAEMMGTPWTNMVPMNIRQEAASSSQQGVPFRTRLLLRDGSEIPVNAVSSRMDEGITIIGFTDISKLSELENRLKAEEAQVKSLVKKKRIVTYRMNLSGEFDHVSRNVKELLGYEPDECAQIPYFMAKIIHPDDSEALKKRFIRLIKFKEVDGPLEYRVNTREKGTKWVRDTSAPMYNDSGKLIGVRGELEDITGMKDAVEREGSKVRLFAAALNEIDDILLILDASQQVVECSDQARSMLGIDPSASPAFRSLVQPADAERASRSLRDAESGKVMTEFTFNTGSGPQRFLVRMTPIRMDGASRGFTVKLQQKGPSIAP